MVGREGLHRSVLLDLAARAGCADVRSFLTTGNVTFESGADDADRVTSALESGVEDVLGRRELVALRPVAWVQELVSVDRFAGYDPAEWVLEVAFLRHDAPALDVSMLDDSRRTVIVEARDRELLAARPRSGGARPHVNRLLEAASGQPATSRGWSTLQRVAGRS